MTSKCTGIEADDWRKSCDVADPSGDSELEIWERIIRPRGPMSKRTARRILELDEDRVRMLELAERNRRGDLLISRGALAHGSDSR
jgi:hypothetical protein